MRDPSHLFHLPTMSMENTLDHPISYPGSDMLSLHARVKPRVKRRKNCAPDQNEAPLLLDVKVLREHFNLPLGEAARAIGVCKTALKRACRKIGMVFWPYRKLRGLERQITNMLAKRKTEDNSLKGCAGGSPGPAIIGEQPLP